MLPLSWKEKYAAVLVLSIGIVFTILQIVDFTSSKSNAYSIQQAAILINKTELYAHIRALVTITCGIVGGIMLLRGRRTGWVIAVALLVVFLLIASGGLVQLAMMRFFGGSFIAIAICVGLLLLALFFLLRPAARAKYKVSRITYLPTFLLLIILGSIYFFLQ